MKYFNFYHVALNPDNKDRKMESLPTPLQKKSLKFNLRFKVH